jgi:YgiT-type zinc finger domain-containing protein
MNSIVTNIPFKVDQSTIVIVQDLPVYQCEGCTEYLFEDPVLKRVDEILDTVNLAAELEIVRYAA